MEDEKLKKVIKIDINKNYAFLLNISTDGSLVKPNNKIKQMNKIHRFRYIDLGDNFQ